MNLANAAGLLGIAAALLLTGCSRDHIKAIEISNQADKLLTSNAREAIEKYEQARSLAPADHQILWRLGLAYQKEKKWDKLGSVMGEAARLAPEFADYHFKAGYAFAMKGENNEKDAYEESKKYFDECIKRDANHAECYFWRGEAAYRTGNHQEAVKFYTDAIQHDPTKAYFYAPLAEIYCNYKLYKEAEGVVKEGTRLIDPQLAANQKKLVTLYRYGFTVAQAKKDDAAMVVALEKAREVAPEDVELNFDLGSTYAVVKPPKKEKAAQLLKAFSKRVCNGTSREKFPVQCAQADVLLRDLEGPGGAGG